MLNKPQRVHETKPNKTATKETALYCAITTAFNSQDVPRQWEPVRRSNVSRTTYSSSVARALNKVMTNLHSTGLMFPVNITK